MRFRATACKDVGCIVHGPAVVTMQAIVRLAERRYARARAVSSKWSGSRTRRAGSDADRQEGQTTNTSRMPASARLECEGGRHADNRAATSSLRALILSTRRTSFQPCARGLSAGRLSVRCLSGAERTLCGDASGNQTRPRTWVDERSRRWRAGARLGPS
jgi:hypothetical protein